MGKRQKLVQATAVIVGELGRPPRVSWCQTTKQHIARADIGELPVVAHGDCADFLNGCKPNVMLKAEARISLEQWQTGEGKDREQITLIAEKIEHHNG